MSNNIQRLKNSILYLSAYFILFVCYKQYLVPVWGYYGFPWNFSVEKLLEGVSIIAILAFILPINIKKPSDFLIHVHFLLPVLPMAVMYGGANYSRIYFYFTMASFLCVVTVRNLKIKLRRKNLIRPEKLLVILFIIVAVQVMLVFYFVGFKHLNINLLEVYGHRSDIEASLPRFVGYINPITTKVMIPMMMIIAAYKKNWMLMAATILVSIFEFALIQHKAPLFFPLLIVGVFFMLHKEKPVRLLVFGYLAIALVAMTLPYSGSIGETISGLFLRRTYFTPASANYGYYAYFLNHEKVMLSNSILTFGLLNYPYELPYQLLVGGGTTWGNTGWLGTSYMHFGFLGMISFGIAVGFILSVIDRLAIYMDFRVVTSVMLVPCFSLFTSADLPTALLTHGILIGLIILYSTAFTKSYTFPMFSRLPKIEKTRRILAQKKKASCVDVKLGHRAEDN